MALLRAVFGDDVRILTDRDFQALLLANALPPMGSGLLSPILDSLIGPFGTTPANVGLLIAFFTAPPILIIPVAGVLADRYGRKPILLAGLMLFGAAGSAIALTTDSRVALGLRLLQGVAFGGITPIIITSIGDLYETTAEATAQGVRFTGSGSVLTIFPLLSGGLVAVAWQYPFLLYATAFPVAALVYVWFDEPADFDHAADGSGTGPGGGTSDADGENGQGGDEETQLHALIDLVRQRRVLAFLIARSLPNVVWIGGFITYNSIVVVRILGGTSAQAGALVALGSFSFAAAASQAGRVTHRFESRLVPLLGANACLGAGFTAFLFAPSIVPAALGITVSGLGFGLLLSLYRSIVTGLANDSLRGSLVSLSESLGRLSSTVTPVAMGGAIGILTPRIGLAAAVQVSGLGVAAVGTIGGAVCLLIANASPPSPHEP